MLFSSTYVALGQPLDSTREEEKKKSSEGKQNKNPWSLQ